MNIVVGTATHRRIKTTSQLPTTSPAATKAAMRTYLFRLRAFAAVAAEVIAPRTPGVPSLFFGLSVVPLPATFVLRDAPPPTNGPA
jgi:hypothetical protein